MNYFLLAVVLHIPLASLAQQIAPDRVQERLDSVVALEAKPPVKPGREVWPAELLMYSEGYIIARPAFLYRNLNEARHGRYAYRLRPGDEVFDAAGWRYAPNSQWLRVARETYFRDSIPHCDTIIYYLRQSAIHSKSGAPPRLFLLH